MVLINNLLRIRMKSTFRTGVYRYLNTLCDPQVVVLIVGVIFAPFMYVCKIPRNTGCIMQMREVSKKNISTSKENFNQ